MTDRPALLFLSQRLPFPPNKGEKITSFNIVKHLRGRFDVHVGTFVDTKEDLLYIDRFRPYCSSLHVERIVKPLAWFPAIGRWIGGLPLSFALFRASGLKAYVDRIVKEHRPVAIVTHSSNISDYALTTCSTAVRILHFADVDSEKFRGYAIGASGWRRWFFALEARRVRAAEARLAAAADAIGFVSDDEAALFRSVLTTGANVITIPNGVDLDLFDPTKQWKRPNWGNGPAFVFTGAMDYQPNIEAVLWFADAVFPSLQAFDQNAQFAIVGSNPHHAVRALTKRSGIVVTGRVAEVQPYLAHAVAAVAPLLIARGIQNKVLEALAMGLPTIVSPQALTGIGEAGKTPVIVADSAGAWINECRRILEDCARRAAFAARGRAFVRDHFSWTTCLATLDALLPPILLQEEGQAAGPSKPEATSTSHGKPHTISFNRSAFT